MWQQCVARRLAVALSTLRGRDARGDHGGGRGGDRRARGGRPIRVPSRRGPRARGRDRARGRACCPTHRRRRARPRLRTWNT